MAKALSTVLSMAILATLAGCASSGPPPEPSLHQKLSIECTASNVERSGCKTKHRLVVEFSANPATLSPEMLGSKARDDNEEF